MIYIKPGVVFQRLVPEIYLALPVIDRLWKETAGFSPTIECVRNDMWVGLRTINLSIVQRQSLYEQLQQHFEPFGYTVSFENRNQHGEHICIGKGT